MKSAAGEMSRAPFDEMYGAPETVRPPYRDYAAWLAQQNPEVMFNKRAEADLVFRRVGITFAVYGDDDGPAPSA
jgi:uncharacterized circularly permuted ATP-grasp superfamily protein